VQLLEMCVKRYLRQQSAAVAAAVALTLPWGRQFIVRLQEVHDSLVSVEAEAERLFTAERALMDADTQDRDRLYGRAQAVSAAACKEGLGWFMNTLQTAE
jgi:hypothetical protein